MNLNQGLSIEKPEKKSTGFTIKFKSDLWIIIQRRDDEDYGFYMINPWTEEGGHTRWGYSSKQIEKLIKTVIKKPTLGYGKEKKDIVKNLLKEAKQIKKNEINKLHKGSINSKRISKGSSKNEINLSKNVSSIKSKQGYRSSKCSKKE